MKRKLKNGEVEIVWLNGARQFIQTQGMVYGSNALVLDTGPVKVIIPMASIKLIRVSAEASAAV